MPKPPTFCHRPLSTEVDHNHWQKQSSQLWGTNLALCHPRSSRKLMEIIRKRGGVQKSMGNKVPWKIGVLIYLPVTSRPLISLQKEPVLSPCNFATTHLTACILNFYLPWTSRPMKRRTLSQRPRLIISVDSLCQLWNIPSFKQKLATMKIQWICPLPQKQSGKRSLAKGIWRTRWELSARKSKTKRGSSESKKGDLGLHAKQSSLAHEWKCLSNN